MKSIKLTNSALVILVDDEDAERLSKYKWYICNTKTAITRGYTDMYKTIHVSFPNEIFNTRGKLYDHIDRNPLNNQKSNLRVCTFKQNMMNKGKVKIKLASSKYKGVSWNKATKKWQARIMFNYKHINLGYYKLEVDAARAYNNGALQFFKEFANLNKDNNGNNL